MAIPFTPPPDWLIQEYMNRKSPVMEGLESVSSLAGVFQNIKAQKDAKQRGALESYIKAFEAGGQQFAQDIARRTGLQNPPALPGLTRTMAGPGGTAGVMSDQQPAMQQPQMQSPDQDPYLGGQSMANQMPMEDQLQQSLPSEHTMAPTSPIISHWNATRGGQSPAGAQAPNQAPAQPPAPGALPGFENPEDLLNSGSWGTKRLAAAESLGKFRNMMEQNQPVSIDKYTALQSGDPNDLATAFPGGIPRALAGTALSAQSRNVRVTNDPYGNPIRVPVAGGPATPVQYPKQNLNPLQQKLNPNEYKAFQTEINDFDKDKTVADNRIALNNMANVETMVRNYNPSLTGPIASRQARAIAGEVGALTDSDVARQSLDPSLLGRLKKAVSVAATGQLPQDQLDLLKTSLAAIKQGAQSRIHSVAQERASRLSNQFGGKVGPDELMQSMNLPSNFTSRTMAPGSGAGPGLSPDQQKRLELLRRKRDEGTLR